MVFAKNSDRPLAQKLISNFTVQHDLVLWIVEFLTSRCQEVLWTCCSQREPSFVLDPPPPPRGVSFLPFSILCIRLIAAVTKRTATYLSLLMTGLYFLSLREHKMVMMRPSMNSEKGVTNHSLPWPEGERDWTDDSWFQETGTHSQGDLDTRWNYGNNPLV